MASGSCWIDSQPAGRPGGARIGMSASVHKNTHTHTQAGRQAGRDGLWQTEGGHGWCRQVSRQDFFAAWEFFGVISLLARIIYYLSSSVSSSVYNKYSCDCCGGILDKT